METETETEAETEAEPPSNASSALTLFILVLYKIWKSRNVQYCTVVLVVSYRSNLTGSAVPGRGIQFVIPYIHVN